MSKPNFSGKKLGLLVIFSIFYKYTQVQHEIMEGIYKVTRLIGWNQQETEWNVKDSS